MSIFSDIGNAIGGIFGGGSKKSSNPLGQVYVKPSEANKGASGTVVGASGKDTQGNYVPSNKGAAGGGKVYTPTKWFPSGGGSGGGSSGGGRRSGGGHHGGGSGGGSNSSPLKKALEKTGGGVIQGELNQIGGGEFSKNTGLSKKQLYNAIKDDMNFPNQILLNRPSSINRELNKTGGGTIQGESKFNLARDIFRNPMSYVPKKKTKTPSFGSYQTPSGEVKTVPLKKPKEIKVNVGGGVTVDGVTYFGNAVVPYTGGKTDNEIENKLYKEVRKKYGDVRGGSYSATIPIVSPDLHSDLNPIPLTAGKSYTPEYYLKPDINNSADSLIKDLFPNSSFLNDLSSLSRGSEALVNSPQKKKIKKEVSAVSDFAVNTFQDIVGVGDQYLTGGAFEPLTKNETKKLGGFASTPGARVNETVLEKLGDTVDYFNPVNQVSVYKSQKEYQNAIKGYNKVNVALGKLNADYSAGKIDYENYKTLYGELTSNKDFKKVNKESGQRKTFAQRVAQSDLNPTEKFVLGAVPQAVNFGEYFIPEVALARGGSSILTGAKGLKTAKTPEDFINSATEIGTGALLTYGGLKGASSVISSGDSKVLSKLAKIEEKYGIEGGIGERALKFSNSKLYKGIKTVGLPIALGTHEGINTYEETGSLPVSLGAGVGATTGILVPGTIAKLRAGTKLTKIEKTQLENELKGLQNQELKSLTRRIKGKGSLPDSTKVDYVAYRETPNFKEKITVSGDLVKNEKGISFFPNGKGISEINGKFEAGGLSKKGYESKQTFNLKNVGKGIRLGNVGDVIIGTGLGGSVYIPRFSRTKIFEVPKNVYGVAKKKILQTLARKNINVGGDLSLNIETPGETISATLKSKVDTEPITERTYLKGLKGTGASFLVEPPKEIGFKGRGSKTPFENTFKETEIKDLKKIRKMSKNVPIIKELKIKELKTSEPNGIQRAVGGTGLTEEQIRRGQGDIPYDVMQVSEKGIMKGLRKGTGIGLSNIPLNVGEGIPLSAFGLKPSVSVKSKVRQSPKLKTKSKQKIKLDTVQVEIDKQIQEPVVTTAQRTKQKAITSQVQKQVTEMPQEIINPIINPRPPQNKFPSKIGFPSLGGFKPTPKPLKNKKGYNVFIKSKGKFKKITKKPIALNDARDLNAFVLDESTARTGRIKASNKKASILTYDIPKGYYKSNKEKFRTFKQKKGKRTKLQRTIIERSPYLSDTKGEKRQLNIFKEMAKLEKKKQRKSKINPWEVA